MSEAVFEKIQQDVEQHPVLIYMKGDRVFPQCGFSGATIRIFESLGVPFETRDVLQDPQLRDAIKRYSNWPTIPQVYVAGEFIGGCDVVHELHQQGELARIVSKATPQ